MARGWRPVKLKDSEHSADISLMIWFISRRVFPLILKTRVRHWPIRMPVPGQSTDATVYFTCLHEYIMSF